MSSSHVCRSRSGWIAIGLACAFGSIAFGADANAVTVKKVLAGLKDPRGVAVRPDGSGESYEVFVAERGAGRVIKFLSGKPEKAADVVAGFSTNPANIDSQSAAGVHSLHFLDHMRLVVTGGEDDGTPFVRLYELTEPESPLTADQHKQEVNVPDTGKANFNAQAFSIIARTQPNDRVGDSLLIVATRGRESTGLVYVPIRSGTLGDAVPAQFKDAEGEFHIGGIAVGKNGYATVATNSAGDSSQPSQLAFFSPLDRRVVMQISTDLQRIVAIAYSPKSGNLFVANSPSTDNNQAGVYRIDRTSQPGATECTAVKIAELKGPTALAFAPDGALYVTASPNSQGKDTGQLLKLTGDL